MGGHTDFPECEISICLPLFHFIDVRGIGTGTQFDSASRGDFSIQSHRPVAEN
jgi:hypothetical protein